MADDIYMKQQQKLLMTIRFKSINAYHRHIPGQMAKVSIYI